MSFFAELKRRNVIRMAGLYLVGAWLIVQVAETVLPTFDVPTWVLRATIILLAIGFVPALIFAWIFELTPQGLQRDENVTPGQSMAAPTARRMDRVIIALLVLALGYFAIEKFVLAPKGESERVQASRSAAEPTTQKDGKTQPDADNSIAVLPFVNMSPDADNEYFADGISEELLNVLAGVEGLTVSSRTSAFSFKGKEVAIPEIARQLGVGHVLEGSVRKQGQQVRITAQLIRAADDKHLWSHTYDRNLVDIFKVQEEIAGAITAALKDILGAQQVRVDAPTRDMAAYQRYLHGRSRFYRRSELDEAVADLRFAVERDPQFADAWAFLAATCSILANSGYKTTLDRDELAREARQAVDQALTLKPELPIALAVKGQIIEKSKVPGRVEASIGLFERAAAMPSPDTTPKLWLALAWIQLGEMDRALPLLESAHQADPMVGINTGYLGLVHAIGGRDAQARALVLEAVKLSGLVFWVELVAIDRLHADDPKAAIDLLTASLPNVSDHFEHNRASRVLELLEMTSGQQDLVNALPQNEKNFEFAMRASLMFGNADVAFELMEQGKTTPWIIDLSAWLPAMQWLREDPRYFRLMQEEGRVEYWDSHGYPRGCRPVDGPAGRHLLCPEQP
jgi:TolB-like protein/Tfp pilus assembly protein PilF